MTSASPLKAALTRALETCQIYLHTLDDEVNALTELTSPDSLADVVQTKHLRAIALNSVYQDVAALIAAMGRKIEDIDEITSADPDLKALWAKVNASLIVAKDLNDSNGVLIDQLSVLTAEKMKALTGLSRIEHDVYTASGVVPRSR